MRAAKVRQLQFVKDFAMPGAPSKPGQGLIRSGELLQELQSDVALGYETLEGNRGSQYLRRSLVRAIFCFIEAGVEVTKIEIRSTVRTVRRSRTKSKNFSEAHTWSLPRWQSSSLSRPTELLPVSRTPCYEPPWDSWRLFGLSQAATVAG